MDWHDLTSDTGYTFCNQVGAEAKQLRLDGIVTVSARREGGDNLPVFCRNAIRHPESGEFLVMTFDPDTRQIVVEEVNE
ncbi:MAG: hypothetical protein OXF73_06700 [Gammaproteobacteria bacterium]|nr:hypothetical protein [Gammaproteobacteria bacterium]MCY4228789.1 hypothetical protein [Gammaproteobacteria bacterium]